jgi:hypothetical protein
MVLESSGRNTLGDTEHGTRTVAQRVPVAIQGGANAVWTNAHSNGTVDQQWTFQEAVFPSYKPTHGEFPSPRSAPAS